VRAGARTVSHLSLSFLPLSFLPISSSPLQLENVFIPALNANSSHPIAETRIARSFTQAPTSGEGNHNWHRVSSSALCSFDRAVYARHSGISALLLCVGSILPGPSTSDGWASRCCSVASLSPACFQCRRRAVIVALPAPATMLRKHTTLHKQG
jgi:hypothetical protein